MIRLRNVNNASWNYPLSDGVAQAFVSGVQVSVPWWTPELTAAGAVIALYRLRGAPHRGPVRVLPTHKNMARMMVHPSDASTTRWGTRFGRGVDTSSVGKVQTEWLTTGVNEWIDTTQSMARFCRLVPAKVRMCIKGNTEAQHDTTNVLAPSGYPKVKAERVRRRLYFDPLQGVNVEMPIGSPMAQVPYPTFEFRVLIPDVQAADGYRAGPSSQKVEFHGTRAPWIENTLWSTDPYNPVNGEWTGLEMPFSAQAFQAIKPKVIE